MVIFDIESKTLDKVVYKYFPENHRDSAPGIFSISLTTGEVLLEVVAEEDHICRTSAKELNTMRDAINEMRADNGEPPLTEEELPIATEDEEYDFAEGTVEHRQAVEKTELWLELADKLRKRIFCILQSEGVEIPSTGQIVVLEPFMKRNGYKNGQGWWVKK